MTGQIILQVILIALSAFFTFAEVSAVSVSDSKLDKLAASGSKKAKRLKKLISKPERFLSALRSGSALVCCLSAAFGATAFSAPLL